MRRAGACIALLAVWLAGCVSAPESRPQAVLEGERQLQLGVGAYQRDEYQNAAVLFSKALALHQSLDDRAGILRSRLNLAETALAVGNYPATARQLALARQMLAEEGLNAFEGRITLLEAGLALKQRRLGEAEALLETLLPPFGQEELPLGEVGEEAMGAVAARVTLAFEREGDDPARWTLRYANCLGSERAQNALRVARLWRFQAELAHREGDWAQADRLLERALATYKQGAYRSGIAATLEQWASVRMSQEAWDEAERLLVRALAVRTWILDRWGAESVLGKLKAVNEGRGDPARAEALDRWLEVLKDRNFTQWDRLRQDLLPY